MKAVNPKNRLDLRHFVAAQQLTPEKIAIIFDLAKILENERETGLITQRLIGKVMAALFYEPSTRTSFSFRSAMLQLGGQVINTENAGEFSSAAKGEILEDTARVISRYADIIVVRHFESGAADLMSRYATVPVINAGDGPLQHPTQALLDLFTIQQKLGRTENLNVVLVGDLKNGRTVRSLAYLLSKYPNNTIHLVSPPQLRIGNDIKAHLAEHNVPYQEYGELHPVLPKADVLYMTRIQKERFKSPADAAKLSGAFILKPEFESLLQSSAIIMHPLPRIDEIPMSIDRSSKAVYFDQVEYGLYIRMALLVLLLTDN